MIPEITFMKKSEDFDGKRGGIWTSGEHAWLYKGLPPFNHSLEYGELPRSYIGDMITKHRELKVKTMFCYSKFTDRLLEPYLFFRHTDIISLVFV